MTLDYRPAFKSVESFKTDKVSVSGTSDNTTFRTEWGIPASATGNELTIRGGRGGDETILYAYGTKDSTEIVTGKLNILSFDKQIKKLYIVPINSAKTRWGSCSGKNSINFSWRLIMADDYMIDYVVVHELMHIKVHNHSDRFWMHVAAVMPDYKERRLQLKEFQKRVANEDWD